MSEEKDS